MRGPMMPRWILIVLLHFALALLPAATSMAQGGSSDDNVLYPQPVLPIYIGPEAGFAWWTADASFAVNDGNLACAAFADGDGKGPTIGMRSFIYFTQWIAVSPRLRYEPRILAFHTGLDPEPARDSRDSLVMLTREADADATISTFTLDLRLVVDLFASGVYLCGGPAFNLLGSGFYDYNERITGPADLVHRSTGSAESALATGRSFDNQRDFSVDLRAGGGLAVSIGRWVVNPEASYIYPLTSSLAPADTMMQRGVSVSFGLMYNFGELR